MERKVKGAMLVDQVKMIRHFRDRDWSKYITPEDWVIIDSLIMDAAWYPLDLYRRLGYATFMVLANGNVDVVRMRGRQRGRELFSGVYKDILIAGHPIESLDRFTKRYDFLFNFSSLTLEVAGEKHVKVHHDYSAEDPANVPYCHQLMGHLDALVEMAGARSAAIVLESTQWEGAPATVFDITWK